MSENRNWSSTGEQIKGALSEALQTGNFKNLNELVSQTVSDAVSEVGKHVSLGGINIQRKERSDSEPFREDGQEAPQNETGGTVEMPVWQKRAQERARQKQIKQQEELQKQAQRKSLPAIKIKRVGNVSNVLYQVFGGIGLGITGLVTFIRMLVMIWGETTLAGWIVNLIFLLGFYGMIRFGLIQKRRLKRAERYLQLCDYRVYGEIENLARGTGKKESYVIRDLERMLARGIFPEGHLDAQKTCFMLNDEVYRQYLDAEHTRRFREEENRRALEQKEASQPPENQPSPETVQEQETELHTMVVEGKEYIRKLRNLNDRIPGETISAKLFCLENLLKDIFDSVRVHPDQMRRMHKLMNYYLPTTLKLVESYEEFDRVSTPGEEIRKAKAEIENTLDTINQAFRELLNTLFQDAVFDATTDAQVLKTMLAREGLTREMEFAAVDRK